MQDEQSRKLDDALDKTFPASDPVAIGKATGTEPLEGSPARQVPWCEDRTPQYGPGSAEPIDAGNKMMLVGIAALAGGVLLALSFMIGDNGTHNDANNRGPSGEAHNPTETPNANSPKAQ